MREQLLEAAVKHAEGQIAVHKTNVEVYLNNPAGIGEHSDIVETIQKELDLLASADDRLEMLKKYF
jgi:hypothetical protein|tara:strand:- start:2009 stop:2206 length:198 start_codon:yes stop_codon:yes gene_type:complete